MAQKTNQIEITETKENLFNVLKGLFPSLFGAKVYTDVLFFGELDTDTSKLVIRFKKDIA